MSGFISELKRRNVFRVGAAYAVVAWLLVQMGEAVFPAFGVPEWIFRAMVVLLLFGFPVILVFAWAFELTPEGLKRDREVAPEQSMTPITGRKLDRTIIVLLALALAYFVFESRFQSTPDLPATEASHSASSSSNATGPASAAVTRNSAIAVLPFVSRSTREDDQFFAEGMHDDLLTKLAKISSLKVISRTSSMKYKGTEKSIPEIARELGVGVILEGGVQRAGDNVRINMQLIEADTDEHLWAETYDRQLTVQNMFQIQSEITRSVASALQATLTEQESAGLGQVPTRDLAAYQDYQRGIALLRSEFSRSALQRAEARFRDALARDPDFYLARVGLAAAAMATYWGFDRTPERLAQARTLLTELQEIAGQTPEYLKARAHYYYWGFRDYSTAISYVDQALALSPNAADLYLLRGFILRRRGDWEAALLDMQRSMELDPLNSNTVYETGVTLYSMKRYREGRMLCNSALDLDPSNSLANDCLFELELSTTGDLGAMDHWLNTVSTPSEYVDFNYRRWQLSFYEGNIAAIRETTGKSDSLPGGESWFAYPVELQRGLGEWYLGDRDAAMQSLAAADRLLGQAIAAAPDEHRLLMARAMALVLLGDPEQAVTLARRSTRIMPYEKDAFDASLYQWDLGIVLAMAGRYEEAAQALDLVASRNGHAPLASLKLDPRLAEAIKQPAFASLLARLK